LRTEREKSIQREDSISRELEEVKDLLLPPILTQRSINHFPGSFMEMPKKESRNILQIEEASFASRKPYFNKNLNKMVKECLKLEKQTIPEVQSIVSARVGADQDFTDMMDFVDFKKVCWYDDSTFLASKFDTVVDQERKKWHRAKHMLQVDYSESKKKIKALHAIDKKNEVKRKESLKNMKLFSIGKFTAMAKKSQNK